MDDLRQSCIHCFAEELKLKNVAPVHEETKLFVDSQWNTGRISLCYVAHRVIVALLITAWIVADFVTESTAQYKYSCIGWFVMATNWSFLTLWLTAIFMAISTTYYYFRMRRDGFDLSRPIGLGLRIQWILYNMAYNGAMVVSVSYWTYVLFLENIEKNSWFARPMSQLKHSLNMIYVVVDILINAVPIRLLHVIYPLLGAVVYIVFNVIYFTNHGCGPGGHPYAYDVMDWRHPFGATITCLLGFISSCLVQFELFLLYQTRLAAYRKINADKTRSERQADRSPADDFLARDTGDVDERDSIFSRPNKGYNTIDATDEELRNQ